MSINMVYQQPSRSIKQQTHSSPGPSLLHPLTDVPLMIDVSFIHQKAFLLGLSQQEIIII